MNSIMNEKYFDFLINKCLYYLNKNKYNELQDKLKCFIDLVDFFDYINNIFFNLYKSNSINNNDYKSIMNILDNCYAKGNGYAENRIEWICELKNQNDTKSLQEHHNKLLLYFNTLNEMLNEKEIDYFHASGFLCCLLINRELERYHHDIDLYVNIADIDKIKKLFGNNQIFKLIHTIETNKENVTRHGYKIECDLCDIPIWLSFYKKTQDGSIYMQEYYQDSYGKYFTKENYNSPTCCELSLINYSYENIPFTSLSLEALYISKVNNRKKDIFDCNVMKDYINYDKVLTLQKELDYEWNKIYGLPSEMENAFFENNMEDNNEKTITKR